MCAFEYPGVPPCERILRSTVEPDGDTTLDSIHPGRPPRSEPRPVRAVRTPHISCADCRVRPACRVACYNRTPDPLPSHEYSMASLRGLARARASGADSGEDQLDHRRPHTCHERDLGPGGGASPPTAPANAGEGHGPGSEYNDAYCTPRSPRALRLLARLRLSLRLPCRLCHLASALGGCRLPVTRSPRSALPRGCRIL